jgi:hypothetical protein
MLAVVCLCVVVIAASVSGVLAVIAGAEVPGLALLGVAVIALGWALTRSIVA